MLVQAGKLESLLEADPATRHALLAASPSSARVALVLAVGRGRGRGRAAAAGGLSARVPGAAERERLEGSEAWRVAMNAPAPHNRARSD